MKLILKKASTNVTVYVFVQDSSATDGSGLTGLVWNSASLVASQVRPLAARVVITLATQTVTGAHLDGGFVEVDATNMPGVYRLDLPDAVCATGVDSVLVLLKGATNTAPVVLEIQLTDFDLNDASPEVTLAAETHTGAVIPTVTTNTDMRGTDSAALASVCTETRLAALTDWLDGGRLDLLLDAIQTDLDNGTDGLGALKTLIDTVNTDLSNGTDGLGALKTLLDAIPTTAMRGTDSAATAASLATVDTVVAAIKVVTDLLPNGGALSDLATLAARLTEARAALLDANALADELLKRDFSAITGEASRSLLNASRRLTNKVSVIDGTMTVTKEDDTATAWTAEVTTDPTADPVVTVDPT